MTAFYVGYVVSSGLTGIVLQVLMGLCAVADHAASVKLLTAWFDRLETEFRIVAPILGITAFVYRPLTAALVADSPVDRWPAPPTARPMRSGSRATSPYSCVGLVFLQTRSFGAAFATLACGPLVGAVTMLFVRERKAFRNRCRRRGAPRARSKFSLHAMRFGLGCGSTLLRRQ
jgi:hypothetical protein